MFGCKGCFSELLQVVLSCLCYMVYLLPTGIGKGRMDGWMAESRCYGAIVFRIICTVLGGDRSLAWGLIVQYSTVQLQYVQVPGLVYGFEHCMVVERGRDRIVMSYDMILPISLLLRCGMAVVLMSRHGRYWCGGRGDFDISFWPSSLLSLFGRCCCLFWALLLSLSNWSLSSSRDSSTGPL